MEAPDIVVSPREFITVKLRLPAHWRFRWWLGFWLIKIGSHLIAHRVTVSVDGSDDDSTP
jgi:hypothetical protein